MTCLFCDDISTDLPFNIAVVLKKQMVIRFYFRTVNARSFNAQKKVLIGFNVVLD